MRNFFVSVINPDEKAFKINLDNSFYGSFAEIGAGQEVARHFFRVGAAAGTIAKTMSAYDMSMSDAIYGKESSGRYVCEERLSKMLDHEYKLLGDRLKESVLKTKFLFLLIPLWQKVMVQKNQDTVARVRFQHDKHQNQQLFICMFSFMTIKTIYNKKHSSVSVNLIYAVLLPNREKNLLLH